MNSFLKNPWSPILSTTVIGTLFFFLVPWVLLNFLNSRTLLIAFLGAGFLLVPWILARLHGVSFVKVFVIWLVVAAESYVTMPAEWEGNPKLAFASHFIPGILLSLLFSMILIGILLKYKWARLKTGSTGTAH